VIRRFRGVPPRLGQMLRFASVGILNTAIDLSLFGVLIRVAHWGVVPANTVAYSAALLNSFLMNRHWTFAGSAGPAYRQLPMFTAFNLAGLMLSDSMVWLFAPAIGPFGAKLSAIGLTFAWNYWSSRRFVFASTAGQ